MLIRRISLPLKCPIITTFKFKSISFTTDICCAPLSVWMETSLRILHVSINVDSSNNNQETDRQRFAYRDLIQLYLLVARSSDKSLDIEVRQLSVRKLRFIHNPFTRYWACAVRLWFVELFWNNQISYKCT